MTADLIPDISIEDLEKLFDEGQHCEYRKDHTGISSSRDARPLKCDLPASWVWIFETTCEHAATQHYLCATHHVLFDNKFTPDMPWGCRTCLAEAFVKEKRRIR